MLILVITIVVILILSGVTITAVMGDQGLINKSEELSNNTNETINQQTEELNNMIKSLQNLSEYRITNAVRQRTKNAATFTNETGQGFTEFIFKYEHL